MRIVLAMTIACFILMLDHATNSARIESANR